jgi:hypothetical protein
MVRVGVAAERNGAAQARRTAQIAREKRRMIFSSGIPGFDITAFSSGQCNGICASGLH